MPLLPTCRRPGCLFPTALTPAIPPWPLPCAAAVSCRVGVPQPHSCFGLDSFQWLSAWSRSSCSTLATGAPSHHWGTPTASRHRVIRKENIPSLPATFGCGYQSWLLGSRVIGRFIATSVSLHTQLLFFEEWSRATGAGAAGRIPDTQTSNLGALGEDTQVPTDNILQS